MNWKRAIMYPVSYYTASNDAVRVQTTIVSVVAVFGTVVLFVLHLMLPSKLSSPYIKYHYSLQDDYFRSYNSKVLAQPDVPSVVTVPSVIIPSIVNCSIQNDARTINTQYNSTYPLTSPAKIGPKTFMYRIALISDMDQHSRNGNYNEWQSYLLKGWLIHRNDDSIDSKNFAMRRTLSNVDTTRTKEIKIPNLGTVGTNQNPQEVKKIEPKSHNLNGKDSIKITWDRKPIRLTSKLSSEARGMELSELVVFNGKLYSCDDRTGIVYEIIPGQDTDTSGEISLASNVKELKNRKKKTRAVARFVLTDGDGSVEKGFKCEWMTVKDQHLIVGGFGKEWSTQSGEILNHDPQFVKNISISGEISHLNWIGNFEKMKTKAGIKNPGYLIHESGIWSPVWKRWFFLPRKASTTAYNEIEDETKGTNLLISSSESFDDIVVKTVGPVIASHGFSSFKFVPNTNDQIIVAIKSMEASGKVSTFVTAFTIDGNILLPETLVQSNVKYEGIEFI